ERRTTKRARHNGKQTGEVRAGKDVLDIDPDSQGRESFYNRVLEFRDISGSVGGQLGSFVSDNQGQEINAHQEERERARPGYPPRYVESHQRIGDSVEDGPDQQRKNKRYQQRTAENEK